MSGEPKRFPLSLSEIAGKAAKSASTRPGPKTATPQTATRNATQSAVDNATATANRNAAQRSAGKSSTVAPLTSAGIFATKAAPVSAVKPGSPAGRDLTGTAGRSGAGASEGTAAGAIGRTKIPTQYAPPGSARGAVVNGLPKIGSTAAEIRRLAPTPVGADPDRPLPMVSEAVRFAMVARVARQGVRDRKVLAAMEAVPRHLFMEPALASQAYIDASLPIGYHQTISQPYIVARMIEVMRDNRHEGKLDRVLEIGTGCGYQAAVLSLVAKEVYSIERIKPLHELAKSNLRPLRIPNIRLHYGDGMLGLPQVAPFDGIVLAAAGLEVPQALLEQLSIGGRLVAPVGGKQQVLQLIERVGPREWTTTTLEDCHFVPLRPGTMA